MISILGSLRVLKIKKADRSPLKKVRGSCKYEQSASIVQNKVGDNPLDQARL